MLHCSYFPALLLLQGGLSERHRHSFDLQMPEWWDWAKFVTLLHACLQVDEAAAGKPFTLQHGPPGESSTSQQQTCV